MSRYYIEPKVVYCVVDRQTSLAVVTGPLEHEVNEVCEVMNKQDEKNKQAEAAENKPKYYTS